jgi:2-C-methyl-D-erythritol 4-phosphate cytidylyltransferase
MVSAIIVAAGSGKRMGTSIPKQFIEINGKTILEHTIDLFVRSKLFTEYIVVIASEFEKELNTIRKLHPNENIRSCTGGQERFHSVQNALQEVNDNCQVVFIHDSVRPYCSIELLNNCYEECKIYSNAIPAVAIKDSIRTINEDGHNQIADRDQLRSIQTPQVFELKKIKEAYDIEYSEKFTDDASVFETAGRKIHLIQGEATNTKITTPEDLEIAKFRLK